MTTLLEDLMYPCKAPEPQVRTKPMKVLALGLSRMGTDSLCRALQDLGYDHVYHGFDVMAGGTEVRKAWSVLGRRKWGLVRDAEPVTAEDLDNLIGHCEAVTDLPCACFALELIEAHPGAKVILNYRDVDPWYESIKATFGSYYASWESRLLSYFDTTLYWRNLSLLHYDQGFFQGSMLLHAKRIHKEHRAMVKGSVPKECLLEWKVQDGWVPLCEFLEKPVPDKEFPSGNTPAQLKKASAAAAATAVRAGYLKLGFSVTVVAAVLVGLYVRVWKRPR